MDNNRLAVFTIAKLEEYNIPRTQEAISVALFLMFPEKFSLVGFPEFPDTERTNRTLLQLGEKYRNWAYGSRHIGFSLNEAGRLVLKQTEELIKHPELQKSKIKPPIERTRDPLIEINEIENSNLYKIYMKGKHEELNEYDFWELMRAFPYTQKQALMIRFQVLQEAVKQAERQDLTDFLKFVHKKYSKLFRS